MATTLVRTDYSSHDAWRDLLRQIRTPSPEGFLADVTVVDDDRFEDMSPETAVAKLRLGDEDPILLIADSETISGHEYPVLCVDRADPGRSFRVVPSELWSVENNLSIANMDFEEFQESVDVDGVFRGF